MKKDESLLKEPSFLPSQDLGLGNESIRGKKKIKRASSNRRNIFLSIFLIVFSPVNIACVTLMVLLLMKGQLLSLVLLPIILFVTILNLWFEFKNCSSSSSKTPIRVLRNKQICVIQENKIVEDDVVYVDNDTFVSFTGVVQEGEVLVDESLNNGVSELVIKKSGGIILEGSRIISGSCYLLVKQQESRKIKTKTKYTNSYKFVAVSAWFFLLIAVIMVCLNISNFQKDEMIKTLEMVAFIFPLGLYLFFTILWFVNSLRLGKKNVTLNDYRAISAFSNIETICIDKTNTLTTGGLVVKKIAPITHIEQDDVSQLISDILLATNDESEVSKNLRSTAIYGLSKRVIETIPFDAQNKYIGASFTGNKSYIVGEPDNMNLNDKAGILRRRDTFNKEGYHVYVLGEASLRDNPLKYTALAFILLVEAIDEKTIASLLAIKEKGIDIKILSGDNIFKCQEIGLKIGNERVLSLKDKEIDYVEKVASKYDVFADCNDEQKLAIVRSLQNEKKVAMIGDGDNDVLALKQANASISLQRGNKTAKQVSQFVLEDNNFENLEAIITEGHKHQNSLLKIFSIYSAKTLILSIMLIIYSLLSMQPSMNDIHFPFVVSNLYAYELFCLVIPSIICVFEQNNGDLHGKFAINVIKKELLSLILSGIVVASPFVLFALQTNGVMYTTFPSDSFLTPYECQGATMIGILLISIAPLVLHSTVLYYPFNKKNSIKLVVTISLSFLAVGLDYLLFVANKKDLLGINFDNIMFPQLFVGSVVLIIGVSIYFIIAHIIEILSMKNIKEEKEEKSHDQN